MNSQDGMNQQGCSVHREGSLNWAKGSAGVHPGTIGASYPEISRSMGQGWA